MSPRRLETKALIVGNGILTEAEWDDYTYLNWKASTDAYAMTDEEWDRLSEYDTWIEESGILDG